MKISDLKTYKVVSGATPVSIPQQPKSTTDKILGAAQGVSDFIGAKGITEQFGSSLARTGLKLSGQKEAAARVGNPSLKEVVGSAIQTGANLLPGAGVGARLATKVAVGAGTGYAFDVGSKLQQDKSVPQSLTPGLGTAVGAGLPVAGAIIKPVARIIGRLFKGLGSGLSGASTNNIETIVNNPKEALRVSQELARTGNNQVLEKNAREIVGGVSRIRQEARTAYGEGLSQLKAEDIDPKKFRASVQSFLDENGVSSKGNERFFDNIEFEDPKNVQRASNLIDELSTVELNGLSLRNLLNKVENMRFKTATSDERLAFNAFTKNMAASIKGAIEGSTGKLGEINQKFSQDMQLAEAAEDIFGSVDFKNLPEVLKASKKLEGLFEQKGLAPDVVDRFLTRIGIEPQNFRTSEAVRQISNKVSGANAKGLSVSEVTQQLTSAVVTPQMIKNLSIATGLTKEALMPFLQAMKPAARNIVIQALLQANRED